MENSNIYLLGFMASGKSKYGKKLAKYLNRNFIDLDNYIEEKEKLSINEIFKQKGEEYFRNLETEILLENDFENAIISLGGGTPCFNDNMKFIEKNVFSVYLKLPLKVIIARLKQNKEKRPLVKSLEDDELVETVSNLYNSRIEYYRKANIHINALQSFKEIREKIENNYYIYLETK